VVLSQELLSELLAVLARSEFALTVADLEQIRTFLLLHGTLVEPTSVLSVCRDPADNRVLECALAGGADVIVTGDRDLLTLHPFRDIDILTPRAFLTRLAHTT